MRKGNGMGMSLSFAESLSFWANWGALNIAYETDSETQTFAMVIATVLLKAGIDVGIYERGPSIHGTTTWLYDRFAFHSPTGKPTHGEPFASAFKEAGIWDGPLTAAMFADLNAPEDVPMLIVGGKPPAFRSVPYFGPETENPAAHNP